MGLTEMPYCDTLAPAAQAWLDRRMSVAAPAPVPARPRCVFDNRGAPEHARHLVRRTDEVSMTPDEQRLARYLEWRRGGERERWARRRRLLGFVAAPALCVLAVALAMWLARPGERTDTTAAVTVPPPARPTPPPEPAAPPARESAPATMPERRPGAPSSRQLRKRAASTPGRSATARRQPEPVIPAPVQRNDGPDVSAAVAPAPPVPSVSAPPREVVASPRPPAEPPVAPAPSMAPPPADVAEAPAAAEDVATAPPSPTSRDAVAVAPPTTRERVASWLKGEVDEFRDGVKREIGNFRSGYDKVRGVFRR